MQFGMYIFVVFCCNLVYNFVLLHAQFYSFFYNMVCDFLFFGVQFCVFLQFGVCDFVFFVTISCENFFFSQQSNLPNVMLLLQ
jgi:hypothetical protein